MPVTSTYVGVGAWGLYYDKLIGKEEPTDVVPVMPYKDISHLDQL